MDDIEDGVTSRGAGPTDVYLENVDREIIWRKMHNLPTLEALLAEEAPFHKATDDEIRLYIPVITDLVALNPSTPEQTERALIQMRKKYKVDCGKSALLAAYQDMLTKGILSRSHILDSFLVKKSTRSTSGVLVITVFTSGSPEVDGVKQTFSCKWNCYYCPNEPGQPRSYLLNEPGVRRANRLGFDAVAQFVDRIESLVQIGHPPDKVEVLVLGGTWESYPRAYQTTFIRDIFYAANTYRQPSRDRKTLEEEKLMNETAEVRLIGITLETRPDTINPEMIIRLRQLGCTRVQLGVQHTDDAVLRVVNRDSTRDDTVRAIRLLKDACFKIDIHLMPDLPGSSPEGDKLMFDDVLGSEELQVDQWKVYPCQITPWTVIKQWFEAGKYKPYGFENLCDVIIHAKRKVHPWIRLNRVIRDIPQEYVLGGTCCGNLRQTLEQRLIAAGMRCKCMRCREVKMDRVALSKIGEAELVAREYRGSGGTELFLSFESRDRSTLFGFLRLRLSPRAGKDVFPELRGCALIRELHVYGKLVKSHDKNSSEAQHMGFGKRLLQQAEEIAWAQGYERIAVISGVGVRTYYARRGYLLYDRENGGFQIKDLRGPQRRTLHRMWSWFAMACFVCLVAYVVIALFD